MKTLVILLGLPGSGKSSFAKMLNERLENSKIFEFDQFVPLEKQIDNMKADRKKLLENVDREIEKSEQTLVFIIDDNNYYTSMRYEYFQLAKKHQIGFCQFFTDVPIEICKKNNESREISVPDEVIDKMAVKLEAPNPLKNAWEQFSFALSMKDLSELKDNLEMCQSMIEMTQKNPIKATSEVKNEEEKSKDRAKCTASVVHQADKCLRKLVSAQIRSEKDEMSKEDLKIRAALLNSKKDELLEDLKTGFTTLPSAIVSSVGKRETNAVEELNKVLQDLYSLKINDS